MFISLKTQSIMSEKDAEHYAALPLWYRVRHLRDGSNAPKIARFV